MSTHTSGPWHVGSATEFRNQIGIEPTIGCVYGDIKGKETKANARLIAAAPELLEALKRSLSWLSSYPGGGAINVYDQAQQAIAKATGEAVE